MKLETSIMEMAGPEDMIIVDDLHDRVHDLEKELSKIKMSVTH